MALIDSPRLSLPSVDAERDHTSATRLTEDAEVRLRVDQEAPSDKRIGPALPG